MFPANKKDPTKMQKLNMNLSWKLLLGLGLAIIILEHVFNFTGVLIDFIGMLGELLFFLGLAGMIVVAWKRYRSKKTTVTKETIKPSPEIERPPNPSKGEKSFALHKRFTANWFKILILVLLFLLVSIYGYSTWKRLHPYKTWQEEFRDKLQRQIDDQCKSGKASLADCLKATH